MLGKLLGVTFSTFDMRMLKTLLQQGMAPWTDFTPTVDQGGAVAATVVYARYAVIGKTAIVQFRFNIAAAGAAGNIIEVQGIPSAIAPKQTGAFQVCGGAIYSDTGTANFTLVAVSQSATTLRFFGYNETNFFGADARLVTAASGDVLAGQLTYEIA